MRKIKVFIVLILCFVNIAWMWKPSKEKEFIQKGNEAFQAGNLTDAMIQFENALMIKPKAYKVLNFLGVIYEQVGVPEKAEQKYLTAIEIKRDFLPPYLNLGFLYWNRGDTDKAVYYFQKRVEMGRLSDPWTMKAKAAIDKINSKKQAIASQIESINTDSIENDNDDQRLKIINEALDDVKLSTSPEVKKSGHIQSQTKKQVQHQAIRVETNINQDNSQNEQQAQAYFAEGQRLASQQQYQDAINVYDRALKLTPGVPQIIKARVDAFIQWKQQAVNES